jgi:hypothetical protein
MAESNTKKKHKRFTTTVCDGIIHVAFWGSVVVVVYAALLYTNLYKKPDI